MGDIVAYGRLPVSPGLGGFATAPKANRPVECPAQLPCAQERRGVTARTLVEEELAVEGDDGAAVRADERLVAFVPTAHLQSGGGQTEAVGYVDPFLVGPPMADRGKERAHRGGAHGTGGARLEDADEAAHPQALLTTAT